MINRLLLSFVVTFAALTCLIAADTDEPVPLEFKRLDLLDGRKLKNVVVRTYDARTDKALVVADKKAMSIAVELIPPPVAEQVRQNAPKAGSSVSDTATRQPPPSNARPPVQSRPPAQTPSPSGNVDLPAHRLAAVERARTFYRYEFKAGSDAIRVQSVRIEAAQPVAVTGWPHRYRTQGTAHLEIFDTKGWSATRATSTFEVVTEQKANESVVVLDFSRKT